MSRSSVFRLFSVCHAFPAVASPPPRPSSREVEAFPASATATASSARFPTRRARDARSRSARVGRRHSRVAPRRRRRKAFSAGRRRNAPFPFDETSPAVSSPAKRRNAHVSRCAGTPSFPTNATDPAGSSMWHSHASRARPIRTRPTRSSPSRDGVQETRASFCRLKAEPREFVLVSSFVSSAASSRVARRHRRRHRHRSFPSSLPVRSAASTFFSKKAKAFFFSVSENVKTSPRRSPNPRLFLLVASRGPSPSVSAPVPARTAHRSTRTTARASPSAGDETSKSAKSRASVSSHRSAAGRRRARRARPRRRVRAA